MADSISTTSGDPHPEGHHLVDPFLGKLTPEFGPNAARNAEMHRLRKEGWTYVAIGRFFGVSAFSARQGVGRHARPPMRIFGLSVRASNVLRGALHCNSWSVAPTLDVIATLSYQDVPGAGSAREVAAMLWEHGLEMPGLPGKLRLELETWRSGIIYATPELKQAADRRAEMHRLREEGWTAAAIAKKFGVSAGHINLTLSFYKSPSRWDEGLSVRACNALRHGLDVPYSVPLPFDVVAALSYEQICGLPCLGSVCAAEIAALLWQYGVEINGMPRKLAARLCSLPVLARPGRSPE